MKTIAFIVAAMLLLAACSKSMPYNGVEKVEQKPAKPVIEPIQG